MAIRLMLLIMGAISLLVGLIIGLVRRHHVRTRPTVAGVVVALEFGGDYNEGAVPIVEYRGPDGRPWRISGDTLSTPPRYQIGQPVVVRYPVSDPTRGKLEEPDSGVVSWLVLAGGGMIVAGLLMP